VLERAKKEDKRGIHKKAGPARVTTTPRRIKAMSLNDALKGKEKVKRDRR